MLELTLPDAARSTTVKQLDDCSRVNSECEYMLFLVHISVQINNKALFWKSPPQHEVNKVCTNSGANVLD